MNIDDYQKQASRTMKHGHAGKKICFEDIFSDKNIDAELLMGAMGLCGESGELMDHMKKALFQGHEIDVDKIISEVGDVLRYVAAVATALNKDLSEIAQYNVEKLKKRFPNGFEEEKSINRDEKQVTKGKKCNECKGVKCGLYAPNECSHYCLEEYEYCLNCKNHCNSCKGKGKIQ